MTMREVLNPHTFFFARESLERNWLPMTGVSKSFGFFGPKGQLMANEGWQILQYLLLSHLERELRSEKGNNCSMHITRHHLTKSKKPFYIRPWDCRGPLHAPLTHFSLCARVKPLTEAFAEQRVSAAYCSSSACSYSRCCLFFYFQCCYCL